MVRENRGLGYLFFDRIAGESAEGKEERHWAFADLLLSL